MREFINKESCYNKKIELIRAPLLSYISKRVYNKEDVNDILQDVCIILFKNKKNYNSNKNFFSWAFSICYFQLKKYFSLKKRNREDSTDFQDSFLENKTNNEIADESIHRLNYIKFHFFNNKKSFSMREFQVMNLLLEGYRQVDISEKLKIKACHVNSYKQNASKKIKNIFEDSNLSKYEKIK